jgi:hypothetical protein
LVWIARNKIAGATRWAEEIALAIEGCKVLVLAWSDASMRSWAVSRRSSSPGGP